jgi:hypothetical protein
MLYTYLHDDVLFYLWKKAVNASMKRGGEGERGRGRNRRGPGACRHGGVAASGMHEGPKHHKPSWAAWVQGAGSKREEPGRALHSEQGGSRVVLFGKDRNAPVRGAELIVWRRVPRRYFYFML